MSKVALLPLYAPGTEMSVVLVPCHAGKDGLSLCRGTPCGCPSGGRPQGPPLHETLSVTRTVTRYQGLPRPLNAPFSPGASRRVISARPGGALETHPCAEPSSPSLSPPP